MSPFFGKPQRGILSHKLKQCISHKLLYTVRKPVNPLVQYYVKKKKIKTKQFWLLYLQRCTNHGYFTKITVATLL